MTLPALTSRELKKLVQRPGLMAEYDDPFVDPPPPVAFASASRLARRNAARYASDVPPPPLAVPDAPTDTPMARRFRLQGAARHLLPSHRVAGCMRYKVPGRDNVSVYYAPGSKVASFGDVQVCGSVWACPVCSSKITEKRRAELAEYVAQGRALGHKWVMVTYTVQHLPTDTLEWLLKGVRGGKRRGGLNGARSWLSSGRKGQAIYEQFGVLGSVRAKEVTWGEKSGWHPHIHELLLVEAACDVPRLLLALSARWAVAVERVGLRPVNGHGVTISETYADIEQYIAKWGHDPKWGIEHEMSKQPVKSGRQGRLSPVQMLASFAETGDVLHGERWREYAITMKGERQLFYSARLRAVLRIVKEKKDEQLAQEHDEPGVLAFSMEDADHQNVCFADVRGEFLGVVAGACEKHEVTLTLDTETMQDRLRAAGADVREWLAGLLPRDASAIVRASRAAPVLRVSRLRRSRPGAAWQAYDDLSGDGWERKQASASADWQDKVNQYHEWGGAETGLTMGEFMEFRAGKLGGS